MDTVILGNGIVGMSIAFRLAREAAPGDTITIIGKHTRRGAATLAAPAMLNSFAEIEQGSLESAIDRYRFALSIEATAQWHDFENEIHDTAYGSRAWRDTYAGYGAGTYVINNAAADDIDDENFKAIVEALEQYREPYTMVDPQDVPNYMPEARHRAVRALRIDSEGWVNPRRLLSALERAFVRLGNVTLLDAAVSRIEHAGARITATVLDDGRRVAGDQYVLASGATVSDLLRASGIDLAMPRVFYGVGVSLELKSPEFPHSACVRTPNRGLACGLYSAPYQPSDDSPGDHIIVGASNFISTEPRSHGRVGSIEALLQGAIQQINTNFYKADLIGVNVGWRPVSQDTYPLMGRTSIDNLCIVSGTRREGIHLAPVISAKLATLIKGGAVDAQFDCFKPERAIIKALTREQAIEKGVRHQISAAYQHGFAPPKSRLLEQLRSHLRGEIERLHDQVGAIDWGIPPEMHDMYRYGHAVA